MHSWTALNHRQLELILQETPSFFESYKKPRLALGIYLAKLKTGETNAWLASLFHLSERIIQWITSVNDLTKEFVSRYLGFDHLRRNILEWNLSVPKGVFWNQLNNKAIIICDKTYVYIERSSNFLFDL